MRSFLITLRHLLSKPSTVCAPIPDPSSNGPSAPSASSRTSTPYAKPPEPVSTASGPGASSTEKETAMLTLTEIAAAIVGAETVVENAVSAVGAAIVSAADIVTDVKKLITYVPTLMQTFENAYAAVGDANNGAGKLAGVLAALEATAAQIGADWNDAIKTVIANIVAQAKAAWNAVASIGKSTAAAAPAAPVASA